jgi:putative endonuclease
MKKNLGKQGEEIAVKYMLNHGYNILERNFYTRYGELDIICCDNKKAIIFVEVKARRSIKYGFPEEAVTRKKQEHLKKAALIYLNSARFFTGMRFDVITILINNQGYKINHIKNAF